MGQKPPKTTLIQPFSSDKALSGVGTPLLAIYVHWPWCLKKCPYCDFNSHVSATPPRQAYVEALCREIAGWRPKIGPRQVVSVFFGGGTPSLMSGAEISQILAEIDWHFGLSAGTEVTAECNPTSASAEVFTHFAAAGINRISVGTQGLSAENLAFLGREHNVGEALKTLENAQKTFKNVNADLIFGLPGQDLAQWQTQLDEMTRLGLAHLSCYQLTIEPNTAFYSQVRRGEWAPLDADRQADFMETTRATLETARYENYETSNYARAGQACQHNLHVWRYGDYLGVGAGAHGRVLVGDRRLATRVRRDPADYLARMGSGSDEVFVEQIPISTAEAWREAIMLGLRLREGVDLARLSSVIHSPFAESGLTLSPFGHLRDQGLLWQKGSVWGATQKGAMVLDSILAAIF